MTDTKYEGKLRAMEKEIDRLKAIEEMIKNDYFSNRTGEMDEATRKKMEELGYGF